MGRGEIWTYKGLAGGKSTNLYATLNELHEAFIVMIYQ